MLKKVVFAGLWFVTLVCIWVSVIVSLVKVQFPQRVYKTEYDLAELMAFHGISFLSFGVFLILSVGISILLDRQLLRRNKLSPDVASRLLRVRLRPANMALICNVLFLVAFWIGMIFGRARDVTSLAFVATGTVCVIAGLWCVVHGTVILLKQPSLKAISPVTGVCVCLLIFIIAGVSARQVSLLRGRFNDWWRPDKIDLSRMTRNR